LLATITFLGLNGLDFQATDAKVVTSMLTLASGRMSEAHFSQWIPDAYGETKVTRCTFDRPQVDANDHCEDARHSQERS
jgi:hypothetical protein